MLRPRRLGDQAAGFEPVGYPGHRSYLRAGSIRFRREPADEASDEYGRLERQLGRINGEAGQLRRDQLGGDSGPRGIAVHGRQVGAMQACAESWNDERADRDGLIAGHHGQVQHVAGEPVLGCAGGHQMCCRDDGEIRTAGVLTADDLVPECCEVSRQYAVGVGDGRHGCVVIWGRPLDHDSQRVGPCLLDEGRRQDADQLVESAAADSQTGGEVGERTVDDAAQKGRDHPLVCTAEVLDRRPRRIRPDLQAVGGAPDTGEGGIDPRHAPDDAAQSDEGAPLSPAHPPNCPVLSLREPSKQQNWAVRWMGISSRDRGAAPPEPDPCRRPRPRCRSAA